MSRAKWARLDNASNIFLAARSDIDPKVFRISAELDEEIDPELLQTALDETYDRYPLYHAVLRSGIFWYYLQESTLRPTVTAETRSTCAPIYRPDRRTLLFRVMHHRRRIILEIFHALSDGTGALWFLTDLVNAYVRLQQPGSAPAEEGQLHELALDSYTQYFRKSRLNPNPPGSDRSRWKHLPSEEERSPGSSLRGVHRVTGTRTPDDRPRLVEVTAPTQQLLALARAEGVSLNIYLTALFFESIRRSSGGLGRARTLAASVPVNLRQFFPSASARNFFATVRVAHRYRDDDDLSAVCRQLELEFKRKAAPEEIERKVRGLIRFEQMIVLRIVPRALKDVLLRLINWGNNRGLTVAASNLGRVTLPEPADSRVGRIQFHVSAVRPQFCAVSHGDLLTISFTSPFVETDHVREFARALSAAGVGVRVAATRVTEEELAEAGRADPTDVDRPEVDR